MPRGFAPRHVKSRRNGAGTGIGIATSRPGEGPSLPGPGKKADNSRETLNKGMTVYSAFF
jgi:hypothetical protein